MQNQDKYKINDIIILDDNIEYSIIKQINNYYVLLSLSQPLKILVVTIENDKAKIVTDKKIIKEVLSK
jgi:hypothetical protein